MPEARSSSGSSLRRRVRLRKLDQKRNQVSIQRQPVLVGERQRTSGAAFRERGQRYPVSLAESGPLAGDNSGHIGISERLKRHTAAA